MGSGIFNFGLGWCLKNDNEQVSKLRAFLRIDPENQSLICDLLDAYYQIGAFDEALACIAELEDKVRNAAGIRFRNAQIALATGHYSNAAELLEQLISDGHESAAIWHDLAFAQLCRGNCQDAAITLAEAKSRFGPQIDLLITSARVNLFLANFEFALKEIETARLIDNDHPVAMGLKALILLDMDNLGAAANAAQECLRIHPNQHEALLTEGTLALWQQRVPEAQASFEKALVGFPNSGRALSGLGQVYMLKNDIPKARELLENAVSAMPDHIGTWHALAWTQLLSTDVGAAEASYEKAYALDRNFADSHGGIALIHVLNDRPELAERSVKQALRLNPDCATAIYAKSLLLSDAGQLEQSDALINKLMQSNPAMKQVGSKDFAANLRKRIQPSKSS